MGSKKRKPLIRRLINILLAVIVMTVGYYLFLIGNDLRVRFINRSEISDISELNEDYANRFEQFIEDIERNTGWKVLIISGLRTKEEQIQLKRDNSKNASYKKSRHVQGRAVDINLYKRNGLFNIWLKKGSSNAEWQKTGIPAIANRHGLLWGGSYHNYHDPVHFEIN